MTRSQTRLLFTTAALFNWGAVLLLSPATGLPQALGLMPAGNGLFDHIALLAMAGFGYGYWLVSRDPASHRGIVVLGLLLSSLIASGETGMFKDKVAVITGGASGIGRALVVHPA